MNGRNILTVYGKELRDMLRDRRTIISMIVIPTLIMPTIMTAIVTVMVKVMRDVAATAPTVMVIGGEDSPAARAALQASARLKIVPTAPNWRWQIAEKKLRAAVEIPAGFDGAIARAEPATLKFYNYDGEVRSESAINELRQVFNAYRDQVVIARLRARGLPPAAIKPFEMKTENVAPPEKVGGNVIGGIIPYFFLLLSFTGAMYPAMDLTAGEKERGTMETILCTPLARRDLVLGKFLTILTASLGTLACSLLSLTFTFTVGGAVVARTIAGGSGAASQRVADKISAMTTVDPVGIFAVLGLVLPMVVLFSAALFTIALFAKSFKEAQSYLSPLIIVIIMPAAIGSLPGIELNARLALVPILNVSLASKELVSGVWHWDFLALIFVSTCVYATIALALAVKMFNREEVIFRT